MDYPYTHDLYELHVLVQKHGHTLPAVAADVKILTPFAATMRYTHMDELPQLDQEKARTIVQQLREYVQTQLA